MMVERGRYSGVSNPRGLCATRRLPPTSSTKPNAVRTGILPSPSVMVSKVSPELCSVSMMRLFKTAYSRTNHPVLGHVRYRAQPCRNIRTTRPPL